MTIESWGRIEAWLSRYAPSYRAMLAGPAGQDAVRAVEAAVGVALPADLRAWWLEADGIRSGGWRGPGSLIPPRYQPYGTGLALETRAMLLGVQRDIYPAAVHAELDRFLADQATRPAGTVPRHSGLLWLPRWLPLAGDGVGRGLFVDLRGGAQHGCVRAYAKYGPPSGPVWPHVSAMLAQVADALEAVDHAEFERTGEFTVGRWQVPYR